MKSVLLIGLGRFGRHMAAKLSELKNDVMAVDKVEERVNEVLPFVTSAQIGDSTNEQFIASLGVRNFDLCVVTIGDNFQSSLEPPRCSRNMGRNLCWPGPAGTSTPNFCCATAPTGLFTLKRRWRCVWPYNTAPTTFLIISR